MESTSSSALHAERIFRPYFPKFKPSEYRILFLVPFIASSLVANSLEKHQSAQKDAKEFASEQRESLMAWLQGIDAESYSQELLSDEDKKAQVDPKEYKNRADQALKNPTTQTFKPQA